MQNNQQNHPVQPQPQQNYQYQQPIHPYPQYSPYPNQIIQQNQQQLQYNPPQYGQIKLFENFTIFLSKELGRGQYGVVYLCIDNNTQNQYACKMVAIQNKLEVTQELQVAQEIRGEFICELKYAGVSSNHLYLIQEYCPDGTLKQYFQKNQNIPIDEIMRIFLQIVKGYKYSLYSKSCVHRDIKLDNILMKDNRPKICDFGFGKFLDDIDSQIILSYKCTPLYGAPQITHTTKIKYTYKADIYSLGVLLYQMTNKLKNPNQMKNNSDLLNFHEQNLQNGIKETLIFYDFVDPNIKELIYNMMEYSEEKRISIDDLEKRTEQIIVYLRNPTSQEFKEYKQSNNQSNKYFFGKTTS
ncbi:hypothetical protein ABPG74_000684 [Tetrahymena malaccensis]